jgi:hypothetical protein
MSSQLCAVGEPRLQGGQDDLNRIDSVGTKGRQMKRAMRASEIESL